MRSLTAVLVAFFLFGCGSPSSSPAGGPSPGPSPRSSVSPGPSESSVGSEEPSESAPSSDRQSGSTDEPPVHAYRRYVAAIDAMTATGGRQTKHLSKVATGVLLRAALDQAKTYRRLGIHTTGQTRILWARTVDVSRTTKTDVTVRACYDTTETKPVDAKGRTALKPGAPTRWQDDTQMHLTSGTWKATSTKSHPTPC